MCITGDYRVFEQEIRKRTAGQGDDYFERAYQEKF